MKSPEVTISIGSVKGPEIIENLDLSEALHRIEANHYRDIVVQAHKDADTIVEQVLDRVENYLKDKLPLELATTNRLKRLAQENYAIKRKNIAELEKKTGALMLENNLKLDSPRKSWDIMTKALRKEAWKITKTHYLPGFMWNGTFTARDNTACTAPSGYTCLDLDHVEDLGVAKAKLESKGSKVFAYFTSPGRDGLKILFRVPVEAQKDNESQRAAWEACADHLEDLGFQRVVADPAAKALSQLCFVSHDANLYVNEQAEEVAVNLEGKDEARTPRQARSRTGNKPDHRSHEPKESEGVPEWLTDALEYLKPHCGDYANWLSVIFALATVYGHSEDGLDVADEWSQGVDNYSGRNAVEKAYDESNGSKSAGTIWHLATEAGWQHPKKPRKKEALNIGEYATALQAQLPPMVVCQGKWYVNHAGLWKETDKALYQPLAQSLLPEKKESARVAKEVLATVEGRCIQELSVLSGFAINGQGVKDRNFILLNCANGVLAVTPDAVELLSHDEVEKLNPNIKFTRQIAASYLPDATCPTFVSVSKFALPDIEDLGLLYSFAAYVLLPDCRFHALLVCKGVGGSGKSTVWQAIQDAIGPDLCESVGLSHLCDQKGYSIPRLQWAAVNVGTEAPAGELEESNNIKALATGEPLEVRPIYAQPYTMRNYHCKLVFLSNHLPRFKSGDSAELRRLRFLCFDRKPDKPDNTLGIKLRAEKDGIFSSIMVPYLQRLLALEVMPEGGEASRQVKERFAVENDPIANFVQECCEVGPDLIAKKDDVFGAFKAWSREQDVGAGLRDDGTFWKHFKAKYTSMRDKKPRQGKERVRLIYGLTLRHNVEVEKGHGILDTIKV